MQWCFYTTMNKFHLSNGSNTCILYFEICFFMILGRINSIVTLREKNSNLGMEPKMSQEPLGV